MNNEELLTDISSVEGIMVSNQDEIEFAHTEFIRDQMVKLNIDRKTELNITESDQSSNSNTFSIGYVRRKMIQR